MLLAKISLAVSAIVALALPFGASAHNHMTSPTPRDLQYYTGANNCPSSSKTIPSGNTFQRGGSFPATWSWNNHNGGFVRFSIVPLGSETGSADVFKQTENIIGFYCHEGTCGKAGFDKGDDPSFACKRSVPVPTWLKDGEYVFQFALYSGYNSFGDANRGLVLFRSCANVKISGGSTYAARTDNKCGFSFTGGDFKSGASSGKCSYFSANYYNGAKNPDLDAISDKSQIKQGLPKEVVDCGGSVSAGSKATTGVTASSVNTTSTSASSSSGTTTTTPTTGSNVGTTAVGSTMGSTKGSTTKSASSSSSKGSSKSHKAHKHKKTKKTKHHSS